MPHIEIYSLSTDFPSGISPTVLQQEIAESGIVTQLSLEGIIVDSDDVLINFKVEPPDTDLVILDGRTLGAEDPPSPAQGLIAAHDAARVILPPPKNVNLANIQQDKDMRIEVAPVPIVGLTEKVLVSPNWCDQTTWYVDSTRVTDDVCVDTGDGINWDISTPQPVIDLYHGKTYDEYHTRQAEANQYRLIVTVNGSEMTERTPFAANGGDYVFDYQTGRITFASSQAGNTVLASYNIPTSSRFRVIPAAGKRIDVQYAETQFDVNLDMNSAIIISIHGYVEVFAPHMAVSNGGPVPDGTVIELDRWYYQTVDNVIEEAIEALPAIPAIGTNNRASTARHIFPFKYNASRDIRNSYGMHLCVELDGDVKWTGDRASLTFYCVERDE